MLELAIELKLSVEICTQYVVVLLFPFAAHRAVRLLTNTSSNPTALGAFAELYTTLANGAAALSPPALYAVTIVTYELVFAVNPVCVHDVCATSTHIPVEEYKRYPVTCADTDAVHEKPMIVLESAMPAKFVGATGAFTPVIVEPIVV